MTATPNRLTRVMVTLTDKEIADVDALVQKGVYRSRSDLGRHAIQKMIYRD